MRSKAVYTSVRIAISVALLAGVLSFVDIGPVIRAVRRADPALVLLGGGIFLVGFTVFAARLQVLLSITGQQVRYLRLLGINFVGAFFSLLLPTTVGGDIARVYKLSRDTKIGPHGLTSVLVDRVIGLLTLLLMAAVALLAGRSLIPESEFMVATAIGFGLIAFLVVVLFALSRIRFQTPDDGRLEPRGWSARWRSIQESIRILISDPARLTKALLLSLLGQTISVVSVASLARAVNIEVRTEMFFVIVPVVWLVVSVPITIGGLGAREGALVFLLGRLGVDPTAAVALSILIYTCYLICGLVGGTGIVVGLLSRSRGRSQSLGPS